MKNKKLLLLTIGALLCLTSCGDVSVDGFISKESGNNDFQQTGNMEVSDFKIDGILDNEEWEHASLEVSMGGTNLVPATVVAKVYFGDNGMTVGYYTNDNMIASSTDYNSSSFVVDSDNVEFYIDCNNDKGKIAKSDDFTFLVNPEEYSEMRTGTGSYWGPWSGVIDYAVSVDGTINDDSDTDTGWGCELFLPYKTFGFTKDSTVGIAFGCRDKTTNLKTSEWTGWIPDPQIIDTYVSINKDGVVKQETNDFDVVAGSFDYDEESKIYTTTQANSMAIHKELECRNGTIECEMKVSERGSDNGIVFQVKPSETGLFWEGSGVRYFFFFINLNGDALLGKTNNGNWATIANTTSGFTFGTFNKLKVVVDGNNIYCFVNGILVLTHKEALYKTIKLGIRGGGKGVQFKNLTVSDSLDISDESVKIDGYTAVNGSFMYANDEHTRVRAAMLSGAGAMMIKEDTNLSNGTLSLTMKPNVKGDHGIVFRVDDQGNEMYWEGGVSYYFFFVSVEGLAYLGRVNGGNWSSLGEVAIDNFDVNTEYNLKVSLNSSEIKCYVNEELYVLANDNTVNGTKCGIRVGNCAAEFSLLTVDAK